MKCIVCIKQVPEISELKFDTKTKTLIREGVRNEINPFDRRALTYAAELKKNVVTCPEHGAQFDVTSGRVLLGPDDDSAGSIQPEKAYKVTVQGDDLMIELP